MLRRGGRAHPLHFDAEGHIALSGGAQTAALGIKPIQRYAPAGSRGTTTHLLFLAMLVCTVRTMSGRIGAVNTAGSADCSPAAPSRPCTVTRGLAAAILKPSLWIKGACTSRQLLAQPRDGQKKRRSLPAAAVAAAAPNVAAVRKLLYNRRGRSCSNRCLEAHRLRSRHERTLQAPPSWGKAAVAVDGAPSSTTSWHKAVHAS
jgi:hypothetical protein